MINKIRITTFCTLLLLSFCVGCQASMPKASITINVTDENGVPLDEAFVRVSYYQKGVNGTKIHIQEGNTDLSGEFFSDGKTVGLVRYSVKKAGYYQSRGSYDFFKRSGFSWEPENLSVKVVLREIKAPVPMYARDTSKSNLKIPKLDTDIGFDLIAFDWVTPYGGGKKADLIFNLHNEYKDRANYEGLLTVKFSNQYDGIVEFNINDELSSGFKYPYFASQSGYKKSLEIRRIVKDNTYKHYDKHNVNYFFRIRSEVKDGNYYRSMYGKIHGGINYKISNNDTAYLSFKYYLNPDYTRNVEFDVMRNLFIGLDRREMMRIN